MPGNAVVRARVDEHVKAEATEVLEEMGLTVSDLIRITMTKVANEHAIPFDLKVPNAETRTAMAEARAIQKARRARFKNGQDLIDDIEGEAGA